MARADSIPPLLIRGNHLSWLKSLDDAIISPSDESLKNRFIAFVLFLQWYGLIHRPVYPSPFFWLSCVRDGIEGRKTRGSLSSRRYGRAYTRYPNPLFPIIRQRAHHIRRRVWNLLYIWRDYILWGLSEISWVGRLITRGPGTWRYFSGYSIPWKMGRGEKRGCPPDILQWGIPIERLVCPVEIHSPSPLPGDPQWIPGAEQHHDQ